MASLVQPSGPRLSRLRSFLEQDPTNARLLAETVAAALDEGEPDEALRLLIRAGDGTALSPELLNLKGLAALQSGEAEAAAEAFMDLIEGGAADPAIRFNLAAARTRLGEHEAALSLLDGDVIEAVEPAGHLKVRALHHLDRLDDALELGAILAQQRPTDAALMGALASIALDAEQPDLARYYAARAGTNPEALAAAATLLMSEGRVEEALAASARAAEADPRNARAALALGSALLAKGDSRAAITPIERAAASFGDHPGSWIAAGWARFLTGDSANARLHFERALACDENFAESHGALAILDIADGRLEEAKRKIEVARRLDSNCFSAALARALLLESSGHGAAAEKVRAAAMGTPVDPSGRTLAQALAAMGASGD